MFSEYSGALNVSETANGDGLRHQDEQELLPGAESC